MRFLRSADFLCLLNEGVRYRQLRDGGYGGPQFLPGFKDVPGMFIELLITRISRYSKFRGMLYVFFSTFFIFSHYLLVDGFFHYLATF